MNIEEIDHFFSFSEEIDMYLHSLSSWKGLESDLLECLEGATKDVRRQASSSLFFLLMKDSSSNKESWIQNAKILCAKLYDEGALTVLANYLTLVAYETNSHERNIAHEQELRTALNILFLIFKFLPSEDLKTDLPFFSSSIEDAMMHLIKISTEVSYIPIKKISILYYSYIDLILEIPIKDTTRFTRQVIDDLKYQTPRHRLTSVNSVESFYVSFI